MNVRMLLQVVSAAALLTCAAPRAHAAPVVGAQFRYWAFDDHNDLRDHIVYYAPGPIHVQLEYWDFVRGQDQFRPEVGLHLRDARRSSYLLQWRHERNDERFWAGTEQVVGKRFVVRGEVSPLVFPHDVQVVYDAGADVYWHSYSFAGVTVIRDPRDGGLWAVPVRARIASERNDWVQFTLVPASQRTIGWAVDAKSGWLKAGIERNSRFDFTTRDNVITTLGVEFPLPH
jgi:hypothetical protein